jgi:hypothetical protein
MREKSELDAIREEAEAKQRAILWPDTLRSGRAVDEFLWRGDPRATPVQRLGLAIYGIMFLFCAILSIVLVFTLTTWVERIVAVFVGSITGLGAARLLMNVFRGQVKHSKPRQR